MSCGSRFSAARESWAWLSRTGQGWADRAGWAGQGGAALSAWLDRAGQATGQAGQGCTGLGRAWQLSLSGFRMYLVFSNGSKRGSER